MNAADGAVEIHVVRHGQTWFNRRGRPRGRCDSSLAEAGHELSAALGRGLDDLNRARHGG
ncbi:histidine phosphatase family protein [uncultured Propionibacterium sp.]|uniref:histidine phosphatase family protein n=1 Tax=uncultured Propionibacterium sp. TaxID=218066 RepID=UPI00292E306A|nr:histidine phosphatase family protein [uncultured Propionibacterium sp.]